MLRFFIPGMSITEEWVVNRVSRLAAEAESRVKEQRALNKVENPRIVYLSDLCVAAHLLCVALWVASHVCDQKYCEQQAPALTPYLILLLRSHFLINCSVHIRLAAP